MVMEAMEGLVERSGVMARGEAGDEMGVLTVEPGATLGDWRGDWSSSSSSCWQRLLIAGGRSGVELCPLRSTGSSAVSAALMSRGSGGGFGLVMDVVRDRGGVAGGARGSFGSRCEARDRRRDGD